MQHPNASIVYWEIKKIGDRMEQAMIKYVERQGIYYPDPHIEIC
jgi:hypothetical protein